MTQEQKLEIVRLRMERKTYAQIGAIMGVSKQRIHQVMENIVPRGNRAKRANWIYPAFAKWVREEGTTATALAKEIGVEPATFTAWMTGANDIRLRYINKLLDYTGMTFEEAFSTKSVNNGEEESDVQIG